MDFLRDVGKHFTVNYLLAKESVKRRLDSEDGISYTEFSYLLLQAYDFLMMFDRYQCTLQLGGSDQWGNIVAGCDLIRKLRGGRAHGLVLPLVTTTSGVKFGKTEAGALWLDPARTAPYEFYQFWINTDDRDVGRYLKYFTFLEEAEIAALEAEHARAPERRTAQRRLASEVTVLVHGEEAARGAEEESGRRFGGGTAADRIRALVESGSEPAIELRATELGPRPLVRILTTTGLATSASEAARLIRAGAVRVNDERVTDERKQFGSEDTHEGLLLVARGGRRVCAVKLVFPGAEVRPEGA
jgi:tyrosyl-tRNA synthetase